MKRFTETTKWDDPWFRGLTGPQKLVFMYVCDRCNNAGFWEADEDSLLFHTKLSKEHAQGAIKGLSRGIKEASGWWWVRRFLRHQKNEGLNATNPAHKQIIALLCEQLKRFSIVPEFQEFVAPYQGLLSPIGIGKVKEQVRRRVKGGTSEHFAQFWASYPRKEKKANSEEAWRDLGCDAMHQDVLDGLERYKLTAQWTRDNGEFVPHPTTWLNGRCWQDDPSKAVNGTKHEGLHGELRIV